MTAQKIYGVQDTMKALKAIEPALQRQAVKDIKWAAEPLRAAVTAAIPVEPPLSGMDHRGRTGWQASSARKVSVKYGGRRSRDKDIWPLVSIVVGGVAGSLYDMAGRGSSGSTGSGQALISGLTSEGGTAARASWPQVEARMVTIQAAIQKAVKAVEDQANDQLNDKPTVTGV